MGPQIKIVYIINPSSKYIFEKRLMVNSFISCLISTKKNIICLVICFSFPNPQEQVFSLHLGLYVPSFESRIKE